MVVVGREKEQNMLSKCLESGKPEFVVVYGRRRVGKTYLIKEYFNNRFAFYSTGVTEAKMKEQLRSFTDSLGLYGSKDKTSPKDWFEAFSRLRCLLEKPDVHKDSISGKKIVFLDEVPWMDSPRSDFKSALDYFWNSWASSQPDIMLIVCGSATSWIIDNIFGSKRGFYNRLTRKIHLQPFTLAETQIFLKMNGIPFDTLQIAESYMIFGGIPYYLNLFDKRLSLAQNVDELLFKESGELYYEYDNLFSSLFRYPEKYFEVIKALSKKKSGMIRTELAAKKEIGDGEPLTKVLKQLEECGFIRKYKNYGKDKQSFIFQLIDPFILFCIEFVVERKMQSWLSFVGSPAYYSWRGYAFEILCLNHIPQIKAKLGISGVESMEYSWNYYAKNKDETDKKVQIDMLIDRKDNVINICEIKNTENEFVVDANYEKQLRARMEIFRQATRTKKTLNLTLISANGLKTNAYSGSIQNVITAEDLFIPLP
ncbi:MAG: ATP-binding protein [Treponemataceae bacterium]|nr:ATP-binding protein [Treponemataceae bacterium]